MGRAPQAVINYYTNNPNKKAATPKKPNAPIQSNTNVQKSTSNADFVKSDCKRLKQPFVRLLKP